MMIQKLKKELIESKSHIYHYTQIHYAYNSNKIEGSQLTLDQTKELYETQTISSDKKAIKLDDLIEMKNHFRLFDDMLDIYQEELSIDIIITMNKILKRNTTDEDNPIYNVGGFKIVPNMIGLVNVINTTAPKNVEKELISLLEWYKNLKNITIEDIIEFHVRFERIHPFSDGNGRVGRMIMFKECLKNNILPFIVLDRDKPYYMRGLRNYRQDNMFLIDTIKYQQDIYESMCKQLLK